MPHRASVKVNKPVLQRIVNSTRRVIGGGTEEGNDRRIGLLPQKGWGKRNLQFVSNVLIPEIMRPRQGMIQTPDLLVPLDSHGDIRVTWVGHATFLIQTEGKNILVDPNWANWLAFVKRVRHPGISLDHLPPIDLVLVTHAHFDHLQLRSLRKIANQQPIVVPRGVGKLVQNRGFSEVHEVGEWDGLNLAGFSITFTPAKHWGARVVHDVDNAFGGYLIKNQSGRTIYHCGDSAYFDGFGEIGRHSDIDLAFLPIGAYNAMSGRSVHMNPEEALEAFHDLNARHMIPMHYGSFPLGGEPMHEPLQRLETEILRRGCGERVSVLTEGLPLIF
jgi:L-ascorbate metabolism protein UlaG (beta-lactamase superfamily)